VLGVVAGHEQLGQLPAQALGKRRVRGSDASLAFGPDGRPGSRVIDDALQQRAHAGRRDVARELHELLAAGVEDHGGGPAVVLVPVGEIGTLVLVDTDRKESLANQPDHLRIAVGGLLHDVAPVAPHGAQVEEDEALLGLGTLEDALVPGLPRDV